MTTHEAQGYKAEMDSEPATTATGRRGVVGAVVVVVFVVVWCLAGVRGIVVDDSRWVWGMFPYVLKAKVERIDFLNDKGQRIGSFTLPKRGRPPPALQVGRSDDRGYGYGKGAWDALITQLGVAAFQTAPKNTVVVEIQHTTRRSEREPVTEIVRVVRP